MSPANICGRHGWSYNRFGYQAKMIQGLSLPDQSCNMSSIVDFYRGKTVLVTGATGFMGKVLVEKLLRACPEVGEVCLMVRPKSGQTPVERIDSVVGGELFDTLRKLQPDFPAKLRPITSDLLAPDLGLSQSDEELLVSRVNIVFHSAALIKFQEHLKEVLWMNVLATQRLLGLCERMTSLQAFIHVSTAFSFCDRPFIEEIVYPLQMHPQKLLDCVEWMDDDMVSAITPGLVGDHPNTYTFSKAVTENLLLEHRGRVPLAIVRPSIVTATLKEPLEGWVDNMNGLTGIFAAYGKGILRTLYADPQAKAELIPVDVPINLMIAAAWHLAINGSGETQIYNCTTGNINPYHWGQLARKAADFYRENPLEQPFRIPINIQPCTLRSRWHSLWEMINHYVPAYICDGLFWAMGKKPRMVRLYDKLHNSLPSLEWFSCRRWDWSNTNVIRLQNQLNEQDRKAFNFDVSSIDWDRYMEAYMMGTKRFVLKEDISRLPACRRYLQRMIRIQYVMKILAVLVAWRLLMLRSRVMRSLWLMIVGQLLQFLKGLKL